MEAGMGNGTGIQNLRTVPWDSSSRQFQEFSCPKDVISNDSYGVWTQVHRTEIIWTGYPVSWQSLKKLTSWSHDVIALYVTFDCVYEFWVFDSVSCAFEILEIFSYRELNVTENFRLRTQHTVCLSSEQKFNKKWIYRGFKAWTCPYGHLNFKSHGIRPPGRRIKRNLRLERFTQSEQLELKINVNFPSTTSKKDKKHIVEKR